MLKHWYLDKVEMPPTNRAIIDISRSRDKLTNEVKIRISL